MKNIALRKELTQNERDRCILRLPKSTFKQEIDSSKIEIEIDGKRKNCHVDKYGRAYLGSEIFSSLGMNRIGCVVLLENDRKFIYKLNVEFKNNVSDRELESFDDTEFESENDSE